MAQAAPGSDFFSHRFIRTSFWRFFYPGKSKCLYFEKSEIYATADAFPSVYWDQLCLKDKALRPYYAGPYYHHEALDGTGYPQGLLKKDIPYEAQIIRVADEFDAIVSKRQYKSHINISDALKIIIENTQPSPNAPQGTGFTNAGKNNKLVVKKLISVVLDDTEYEIACTMNYLKYLEEQIKRLKNIEHLITKMNSAKKQEDIDFYKDYIPGFFKNNESFDNFDQIFQEYNDAYTSKKKAVDDLFSEIKKIKKLKV